MKRLSLAIILVSCVTSLSSQAPSYVNFEWDVFRFGYAVPLDGEVDGGLAFGGEVRYNATDHFSIGIGGDGAVFTPDFFDEGEFGISGASLLLGDFYYSNTSGQRLFTGLGVGLYSSATITTVTNNVEEIIQGGSGFGIAPRIGYEFNHIRLQGQYNWILKDDGPSNYFGVTVALTLWGGYRGGSSGRGNDNNKVLD